MTKVIDFPSLKGYQEKPPCGDKSSHLAAKICLRASQVSQYVARRILLYLIGAFVASEERGMGAT